MVCSTMTQEGEPMTDTSKPQQDKPSNWDRRWAAYQKHIESHPSDANSWSAFYNGCESEAAHAPKGEVDTSKERAAFEKWADSKDYRLERWNDAYISISTDYLWRGWMARATKTPPMPDVEQLAVDLCRELYDRFMMGGWTPEDAHAETILRLQQWAEAPRPVEPGTK
jgi:hypothetical protein